MIMTQQQHGAYANNAYELRILRQFDLGDFALLETPYSDYLKSILIYSPKTDGATMKDYAQMILKERENIQKEQSDIENVVETNQPAVNDLAKKKCQDFASAFLVPNKPTRV